VKGKETKATKGRLQCQCQAIRHALYSNCTACGKVICEQVCYISDLYADLSVVAAHSVGLNRKEKDHASSVVVMLAKNQLRYPTILST
jgi:hypothetical protein